MTSHPFNLGIRFLLEVVVLISVGIWGWHHTNEVLRIVLGIGLPVLLASIWGVFAVPDDPSRSGEAPVSTPGIIRLVIELVFFTFGMMSIYDMGLIGFSVFFGVLVVAHYLFSYDRILWLLSQ